MGILTYSGSPLPFQDAYHPTVFQAAAVTYFPLSPFFFKGFIYFRTECMRKQVWGRGAEGEEDYQLWSLPGGSIPGP